MPLPRTAALFCAGLMLAAQSPGAQQPVVDPVVAMDAAQIRIADVRFAPAQPVTGTQGASLQLTGRVVVPNSALDMYLSPVDGRVEALLVDPGQAVRAGQPLLQLRSAGVLALQRELVAARGRADVARSRAMRDAQLHAEGIIAANRLQESQAAETEALARLREQEHLLRLAGFSDAALARLRSTENMTPVVTLQARRGGHVLTLDATVGQSVNDADPLLQVATLGQLWIEMQATRAQAALIQPGDPVHVAGCRTTGRVLAAAIQLDAQSQTATVRASIPDAANCLSPNQFVEVQVAPQPSSTDILAVARTAVIQNAGSNYVFVRQADGLRVVTVTVERRTSSHAWVRGSLRAGDEVAVSGLAAIKGLWLGLGAAALVP